MEMYKGFEYDVDVKEDIDMFSKIILTLVNVRSSMRNGIVDLRTLAGTNRIIVTASEDSEYNVEEYLEQFGEVKKTPIQLFEVSEFDLMDVERHAIAHYDDYLVTFDND